MTVATRALLSFCEVQENFVKIQEAYELLSDQSKRKQYDSSLDFDETLGFARLCKLACCYFLRCWHLMQCFTVHVQSPPSLPVVGNGIITTTASIINLVYAGLRSLPKFRPESGQDFFQVFGEAKGTLVGGRICSRVDCRCSAGMLVSL